MLGFKQFENAAITIGGVELIHRICKGQFALGRLHISGTITPEIWNAVLAAERSLCDVPHRPPTLTYQTQTLQQKLRVNGVVKKGVNLAARILSVGFFYPVSLWIFCGGSRPRHSFILGAQPASRALGGEANP